MVRAIILLPAKNEESGIGEVIDRIPSEAISSEGFDPEIIVVDGNSEDSTVEIARGMGSRIIIQNSGPGKGNGIRDALEEIYRDEGKSDEDIVIMLDADATYSPEDIPRFIDGLKGNEVVWGSRLRGKIESGAMSATNKLGNRILSISATLLFFKKTTDLCTGFWGFRSKTLEGLHLTAEGFSLEADLFCSVAKTGVKTLEIPIDYANREGVSNLKWYIDGPKIFLKTLQKRVRKF